jgi:beta-phosphoglucomutase-like phosphatase (HAD superfamily)
MTLGIVRRREAPPEPHAQELDPKPGAAQLIEELAQLEALKEAGILSASQYMRQRAHIFSELV